MGNTIAPSILLCTALALGGCSFFGFGNEVYFKDEGNGWVEIERAEYEALQTAAPAPADPAQRLVNMSDAERRALSDDITRDICNIPEGQPITPETPCDL